MFKSVARKSVAGLAALAFLAVPVAAQTAEERSEAKFAELTEGRVAGEPESCVPAMRARDLEVVEYLGFTYEQGDTLWISRVRDPRSLGWNDVPIIERFGSQLCKFDVIRTVDRGSNFFSGVVFLEDFVPYTKVADEG